MAEIFNRPLSIPHTLLTAALLAVGLLCKLMAGGGGAKTT